MKTDKLTIMGGLCVLLAIVTLAGGCGRPTDGTTPAPSAEAGHAEQEQHGEDDGHGHAPAAPSTSIEERVSAHCECGVPTYQCDECRYEAGVVRVAAGLLKRSDGTGLMRTQSVTRAKVHDTLTATGEVALNDNAAVHVSSRIPGIIETVSADIGARVKAGDTLLTLASVELGRTLADHERNRALTELSAKTLARETKLREQNVVSEQDVIDAQMAHEQHRTDLRASEQMLHVLGLTEDDLATLRAPSHGTNTGRLPIRAPTAGTILEKHAVPGEMAEPGKDLMLLCDLTTVWAWADVHSRDLAGLLAAEKRGPVAVDITVAAFPDRPFRGQLDYVGATMDERTRTVKVRATVGNPDQELRPGMFCEVAIALGNEKAEEVLTVPRIAVLADEGQSFVFIHWKDDYFVRQDVTRSRAWPGAVEVREGLKDGDAVVTEGAFLLKSDVLREKMGAGCAD